MTRHPISHLLLLILYVIGFVLAPAAHLSLGDGGECGEIHHAHDEAPDGHGEPEGEDGSEEHPQDEDEGHCEEHCSACRVLHSTSKQDLVLPEVVVSLELPSRVLRSRELADPTRVATSDRTIRGPPSSTV